MDKALQQEKTKVKRYRVRKGLTMSLKGSNKTQY